MFRYVFFHSIDLHNLLGSRSGAMDPVVVQPLVRHLLKRVFLEVGNWHESDLPVDCIRRWIRQIRVEAAEPPALPK